MHRFIKTLTITILLMTGSSVLAQEQSPHELMTSVATNLFSRLSAQQERLQNEPALVNQIVEEELMPYVDYRYAAFKILGKNLRSTSKQEREDFAIAMQDYLTVIYVNALRQYKNQTVSFQAPVKKHRGKIAVVKALISDTGAPDISIDFKLRQDKNTREWKAFDMVVEGISMLNAKQAEINARISASSLEQVTEELESLSAE